VKKKLNELKLIFKQGLEPDQIAWCISLGLVCGVFPVMGTTTILVALIALVFRLNIVLIQLIHWLVSPLQLLLLIPFFQLGQTWFGGEGRGIDMEMLKLTWDKGWIDASILFINLHKQAVFVWVIFAIPSVLFVFLVSKFSLKIIAKRNSA
jgi:uncharacterized protein (DUF2062 family)